MLPESSAVAVQRPLGSLEFLLSTALAYAPCHSESDIDVDLILFFVFVFDSAAENLAVLSWICTVPEFPPLFLHKRICQLSLTLPLDKNKLMLRFRRLRRDSRFSVQAQFL